MRMSYSPNWMAALCAVVGLALVLWGVALVFRPAALILAGCVLILIAYVVRSRYYLSRLEALNGDS